MYLRDLVANTKRVEQAGRTLSMTEAMALLWREHLVAHLPPAAIEDPDAFRCSLLYTIEMEAVLEEHRPLLHAMFNMYKGVGSQAPTRLPIAALHRLLQVRVQTSTFIDYIY
eukprot:1184035-Prorocentrum_minimum.AAC.5